MNKIRETTTQIIQKINKYKKENKKEFYFLILIVLVGSFLRLYRINDYLTFLGDEGRDVLIVRRLIVDLDPILIGPGTSIGNMYLGPLYYYMMAPPLLLANFSPVGPAVMVALLGVVTIVLVWLIACEWFGKIAAFTAALLYAVSPVVIKYSQSSWNPNIMPFFALLSMYSIWRIWQHSQWKWIIVTGVSMAFVLQSHYIALLMIPVVGIFWLLSIIYFLKNNKSLKNAWRYSIKGLIIFLILMSPLLIFDIRHNWINFQAMKVFFTQRQSTVSVRPWTAIPKLYENLSQILTSVLGAGNEVYGFYLSLFFILIVITVLLIFLKKFVANESNQKELLTRFLNTIRKKDLAPYVLLLIWLIISLFGFGVYKQHIYDHYFGFLFPVPIMLLGGVVENIWRRSGKTVHLLLLIFIGGIVSINLSITPIRFEPNRQLQRTREIAELVVETSEGKPFNFAILAERNYESSYVYLFEKWDSPLKIIDPSVGDETITEQLFIVCELEKENCDPFSSDRPEVTWFGTAEVVSTIEHDGFTIFKLEHQNMN